MREAIYWIEGPWPGRLAIMPRPRGGDWLRDEVESWRKSHIDGIVSLLPREEQIELGLLEEEALCRERGMDFMTIPIIDRSVPLSFVSFSKQVLSIADQLASGQTIAIHCRQGVGRAALVAATLLIVAGMDAVAAMEMVGKARGCVVPETGEQRRWVVDFAHSLVTGTPNSVR